MSQQHKPHLRVAILCNGSVFEAWEAACIREVMALPFAEVVLRIAPPEQEAAARGFGQKLLHYPWKLLLWNRLDKKSKTISARRPVDMNSELAAVPLLYCLPEKKGKYSEYFSEADLATIRTHQPDIILRFGYNIIRGEILTVAPYGVWSFHHADEQVIRGGPGAFWEIMHGHDVTGALLQRLTDRLDAGIVLRKGWFPTVRHSYLHNLDQLLWGTTSWMKQVCIAIHHNEASYFNAPPLETTAPVFRFPRNGRMLLFVLKLFGQKIRFHYRELFCAEQWNVGIVRKPMSTLLQDKLPAEVAWLPEAAGKNFKADPFGFTDAQGNEHVLYERYDFNTGKGVIEMQVNGNVTTLLQTDFHLSFPFLFTHEGKRYLLPEANASGKLTCYELDGTTVKPVCDLLPVPAVDANIVYFENRWWLFCTNEDQGSNHALFVYHSAHPLGPWEAHACNPVKCDVRSARPAGAAFVHNGKLYRPAQCCVPEYGSAVILHEVLELTPTRFREVPVQRLEPHPQWKYTNGLHHLSALGEKATLVDAKYYRFSFSHFLNALKRKRRRLLNK